jgi:xylitol oxidase
MTANWSGNYTYGASVIHRPRTLDELLGLLTRAPNLRVLGSRHSFTSIADSAELVSLHDLEGAAAITVDRGAMSVSVGPAVTYASLADELNRHGLALANLASLPHISIAGAISTASHGSGDRSGNLATSVVGLQLALSTGEALELESGETDFDGAVVGLGALGALTRVTLAVEPYYELRQEVYVGLPWDRVFADFGAITAAGRSVSVFHRFGERTQEVWLKHDGPAGAGTQLFGAAAASEARNPVPGADPANCTPQLGELGPWSERLPHFRSGFTPSAGLEIQSEFFLARPDAVGAVQALQPLADQIRPLLLVAEIRTIAADSLWMSPHHERDSVGLHFTWRRQQAEVEDALRLIEQALEPFAPRPHWGKLFTARAATIAPRYSRIDDFRRLRDRLDPRGVFFNAWLRERVLDPRAP